MLLTYTIQYKYLKYLKKSYRLLSDGTLCNLNILKPERMHLPTHWFPFDNDFTYPRLHEHK